MQSVVSVGFAKIALQSDPIPSSLKALRVFSERQTQKFSLFVYVLLFCMLLFQTILLFKSTFPGRRLFDGDHIGNDRRIFNCNPICCLWFMV